MKRLKRSVEYKGKTVSVMLEFPTDANNMEEMKSMEEVHSSARQEFENLLKKMYLDRMKSELNGCKAEETESRRQSG